MPTRQLPNRTEDVSNRLKFASVELTSEDPRFLIESVFTEGGQGWLAGQTGEQQIRLIFDGPVSLRRRQLQFSESAMAIPDIRNWPFTQ